jgi:hypothetical protein
VTVAALATPSDLASWLQKDLDTATATLALAVASDRIRDHVGWSITQETGAVFTLDGTGTNSLWLPTQLLTAVTSVVENGITLTVVTQFDWTTYGRLIRQYRCWTDKMRSVVATITHGYAPGAAELDNAKGVCLSLAARVYDNPTALRSYTVGGVSETYAGSAEALSPGLSDDEKRDLVPYRLPVVG